MTQSRKLIGFFFILCPILGAYNGPLLQAYKNHDITSVQKMIRAGVDFESAEEKQFYTALLERDADKAIEVYKQLYSEGSPLFKYLSAERLHDYYYARGYYTTAAGYRRYMVDHAAAIQTRVTTQKNTYETPEMQDESYYIQVGAFGIKDNALQMVNMLRTQNYPVYVKERVINSRTLYCVWITGKSDFPGTLKLAEQIKQKYHLNYKLLKE